MKSKAPLALAILIITLGVGSLVTALGLGPGVNWLWTLGLAVVGVLTFVLAGGVDKLSIVVAPFFLISSILSILRQTGSLRTDIEVPILIITIGVLFLIAQMKSIPIPSWFGSGPS